MLLTTQGCARLRTGAIIMHIRRGYQKKSLLCRKARYVRSLGKKPHFWPSQRLKKVLLTTQGCASLRTGPIIMQIPRGYHEKKFIVYKVFDFVDKVGISVFRGVVWVPQKKVLVLVQRLLHLTPQIPLRHQKTFHLALFLSNLAILNSAALFLGLD